MADLGEGYEDTAKKICGRVEGGKQKKQRKIIEKQKYND